MQFINMKNQSAGNSVTVVGYPVERAEKRLLQDGTSSLPNGPSSEHHNKRNTMTGRKADNLANGIREHVGLGPKIAKTLKEKLSMGTRILKAGGIGKKFKHHFSVTEGEKLLKASQCYLSTTAGPIAGILFISTHKVAFCSDRSIEFSSPTGEFIRIHYKVSIPVGKILRANESQNVKRPSQKYIEIVTVDNFDFWFMGFINYQRTFKYLQQAISQAQCMQNSTNILTLDVFKVRESNYFRNFMQLL